jgi:hypothetical protein
MSPHAHIRSLPPGTWKVPFVALGAFASFEAARQEAA